jgi:hypothetical protein
LKKRSKTLLSIWRKTCQSRATLWIKVFWFFFSKKKALAFLPVDGVRFTVLLSRFPPQYVACFLRGPPS